MSNFDGKRILIVTTLLAIPICLYTIYRSYYKSDGKNKTKRKMRGPTKLSPTGSSLLAKLKEEGLERTNSSIIEKQTYSENYSSPPYDCQNVEDTSQRSGLPDETLCALVMHLDNADEDTLKKILVTIGNAAAFSHSQDVMRNAGCLKKLTDLLKMYNMTTSIDTSKSSSEIIVGIANTINNLSLNECNQETLQECIPSLIDFANSDTSPEPVKLAALQALTNLSVTAKYHLPYTQIIQQLYNLLDIGSESLKTQSLRIIINLSCNSEMVPHLMAAKAPRCMLKMLSPDVDNSVQLRWTTILANMVEAVKVNKFTSDNLPCEYKAPSPETMFSALYGVDSKVKSKVYRLTRLEHENIKQQAIRIHACL